LNFFGHAVVAAWRRPEPALLFGAMLPDLIAMAGAKLAAPEHPDLVEGLALHHTTDRVFHRTETFLALQASAQRQLASAKVRPGPRRAAAHVGVELMIDAELGLDDHIHQLYLEALDRAANGEFREFLNLSREEALVLEEVCVRVRKRSTERQTSAPALTERLRRALHHRPRLRLASSELPSVEIWLERTRPDVRARLPALVTDLRGAIL
jgi:hypothetical protein